MAHEDKISILEDFAQLVRTYRDKSGDISALRREINRKKGTARSVVIEAGVFKTYTIGPPPAIGGLIMHDVDLFEYVFEPIWGRSMNPQLLDMIDEAIGAISAGALDRAPRNAPQIASEVRQGYVFVAMAIDASDARLEDVLDAVKQASNNCGLQAERVDEQQSNDRITDRILESIRVAQFVVADLTHGRPNVFYEAGYAHGLGKIPVYIARDGTKLEFDVKDYPVIFFSNMRSLREQLEARLRSIAQH